MVKVKAFQFHVLLFSLFNYIAMCAYSRHLCGMFSCSLGSPLYIYIYKLPTPPHTRYSMTPSACH